MLWAHFFNFHCLYGGCAMKSTWLTANHQVIIQKKIPRDFIVRIYGIIIVMISYSYTFNFRTLKFTKHSNRVKKAVTSLAPVLWHQTRSQFLMDFDKFLSDILASNYICNKKIRNLKNLLQQFTRHNCKNHKSS